MSLKRAAIVTVIETARRRLEAKTKVSFNDLRRQNDRILITAHMFSVLIELYPGSRPSDLRLTLKKGEIDTTVVTDLNFEKAM